MVVESLINSLPFTVIAAVVGVVLLINVVVVCVCGDKKPTSPKPLSIKAKENGSDINHRTSLPEDQMTVVVESPPNQSSDARDSTLVAELSNSRNSHVSVGSNSSRPTSTLMRQLPEPPKDVHRPMSAQSNGSVVVSVEDYPEDDPYDHLGKPHRAMSEKVRPSGYEVVDLNVSNSLTIDEQIENEYSIPKGEDEMDIYAKVEGEEELPSEPKSYQKPQLEKKRSERDGGYAKVKDRQCNPSDVREITLHKDDPYSRVQGDDYSAIDETIRPATLGSQQTGRLSNSRLHSNDEEVDDGQPSDEYATVNKVRNKSSSEREEILPEQRMTDPYMTPPEPPRGYDDTFGLGDNTSAANTSTVNESNSTADTTEQDVSNQPTASPTRVKREPSYTKVTARESLSSMAARYAFNTYEIVPDVENTYATVEGGSGDGVVQKTNQRNSFSSETYAEIEGSAGGFSPVVPAPPSLDTLHMMTKQNPDPSKRMSTSTTSEGRQSLGSPSFPHSPVEQSELTASPRSSVKQDHQYENATIDESRERFLLQGARPKEYSDIDHKDETENNTRTSSVSLDPNYHSVRDSVHDLDVEFDPNYESVEEAQNKVAHPHNRKHEYEEVKKVSDDVSKLREQVLRRHTYEDIVDVKEQTEELKRKSGEIK